MLLARHIIHELSELCDMCKSDVTLIQLNILCIFQLDFLFISSSLIPQNLAVMNDHADEGIDDS